MAVIGMSARSASQISAKVNQVVGTASRGRRWVRTSAAAVGTSVARLSSSVAATSASASSARAASVRAPEVTQANSRSCDGEAARGWASRNRSRVDQPSRLPYFTSW